VLLLVVFLAAFRERIEFPSHSIDNPVGIPGIEDPEKSRLGSMLFGFFIVFLVAALASVVVRYLRSGACSASRSSGSCSPPCWLP
jgi:hypothetical protein